MENNSAGMQEMEISLLDLFVEILLHWRMILLLMLVGGALFAGYSYVRSVRAAEAQKEQLTQKEMYLAEREEEESEDSEWTDANQLWIQEQLTEQQLSNVSNVLSYEAQYEQKALYQERSVLMQLDPLHVARADLTFLIKSDDLERTYNIEKIYEDLLTSTALYDYVQETCGIDGGLEELITLETSSYGQQQGNDTVRMSVLYSEEESCGKIADAIVDYAKQQRSSLESAVGAHELVVLSRSVGSVMSTGILNQQKNCETELINLRNSSEKLKEDFSDEEWNYYNYMTEERASIDSDVDKSGEKVREEQEIQEEVVLVRPGVSMKYLLLGMVLFALVYIFLIFLCYIMSHKLRATDNLQDIYGIAQFAVISVTQRKKRFLDGIDRWILKLRYRNQRRFTPEEACHLTTVAVKMAARRQELNQICLIGCNLSKEVQEICSQMGETLDEEGMAVQILNNVLYDAEAMENLEKAQGAVLVETAGSTLYEEIAGELALLGRQKIPVLGGVIVE